MSDKPARILDEVKKGNFPRGSDSFLFVQQFRFGERTLSLYFNTGYTPSCSYTLWWDDESSMPVQHNMSDVEVFNILHGLLEEEHDKQKDAERERVFSKERHD